MRSLLHFGRVSHLSIELAVTASRRIAKKHLKFAHVGQGMLDAAGATPFLGYAGVLRS